MPLDKLPGSMPAAPAYPDMMTTTQEPTTNLLSLLMDAAFGFIGGLMVFFGPMPVIQYGSELAMNLIAQSGYGNNPMAALGFTAAPYMILAPVGGFALKELASVRSIKGFLYFAVAVLIGFAIAFFSRGYFATLIK